MEDRQQQELDALREIWDRNIGIGQDVMDISRIYRSFGYEICAAAFERAKRKRYNCPDMTALSVCKYTCSVARNMAIALQEGGDIHESMQQRDARRAAVRDRANQVWCPPEWVDQV